MAGGIWNSPVMAFSPVTYNDEDWVEMRDSFMNSFEEAMNWMNDLQKFGIRPGLERMTWMLKALGNPHNRLKFIHIAGTNGKGSTLHYISQVLMAAGYQVGTFTSPAIDTFTSRIEVNEQSIPDSIFVELANRVKPLAFELEKTEWGSPTEFEITTVIAILYFSTKRIPDFVVWETGLGGRMDSTNVVHPLVSVITNIGYDHMDILGTTKQEIAFEKAGIIKNGVPVITTEIQEESLSVIESVAKEKKSPLYRFGRDFTMIHHRSEAPSQGENFDFKGPFRTYPNCKLTMLGQHQVKNAALSIMVLEVLRQYYAVFFEPKQLKEGLLKANWPGRFEILHNDPYLIVDGAHNPEGVEVLRTTLEERFPNQKLKVLFSALRDKDVKSMIEKLAPICHEVLVTRMDHPRVADPVEIEAMFRDSNPNLTIRVIPDWATCLDTWFDLVNSDTILLATGSLYFISDIRKVLQNKIVESCDF